jgi:hypothetical protein
MRVRFQRCSHSLAVLGLLSLLAWWGPSAYGRKRRAVTGLRILVRVRLPRTKTPTDRICAVFLVGAQIATRRRLRSLRKSRFAYRLHLRSRSYLLTSRHPPRSVPIRQFAVSRLPGLSVVSLNASTTRRAPELSFVLQRFPDLYPGFSPSAWARPFLSKSHCDRPALDYRLLCLSTFWPHAQTKFIWRPTPRPHDQHSH